VCCYWLLYVVTGWGWGGGWQAGHAQSISLHQHAEARLHVAFDPWSGVSRVRERGPLLVEAVVWRVWHRGQRSEGSVQYFISECCSATGLVPGWLYTVEMSILKVPMWVIRKARVRLWNTWEQGTSTRGENFRAPPNTLIRLTAVGTEAKHTIKL